MFLCQNCGTIVDDDGWSYKCACGLLRLTTDLSTIYGPIGDGRCLMQTPGGQVCFRIHDGDAFRLQGLGAGGIEAALRLVHDEMTVGQVMGS